MKKASWVRLARVVAVCADLDRGWAPVAHGASFGHDVTALGSVAPIAAMDDGRHPQAVTPAQSVRWVARGLFPASFGRSSASRPALRTQRASRFIKRNPEIRKFFRLPAKELSRPAQNFLLLESDVLRPETSRYVVISCISSIRATPLV